MYSFLTGALIFILAPFAVQSQPVTLNADGPGNTYELINSVLAPGYNVVEHPECTGGHPSFDRHIVEVWDAELNANVFEFYSHVAEDNDRCINFDRQRVEIKTYDQSPANLIGTLGETITYKWRFRLAAGFKPSASFTHIHQIKPVNGDDANPLITLTPRKGTTNKMELIHNNVTKVAIVDLSLFTGVWVEATEVIKVGANGTYSMVIKRVSDDVTILSYSNSNIMTIRPDNDFIRPKWGIYRSLNNLGDLRDDSIRFNAFSIEEQPIVLPINLISFKTLLRGDKVDIIWTTATELNSKTFIVERSADGINFSAISSVVASANSNTAKHYQYTDANPPAGKNFYRLKMIDISGSFSYSAVAHVFLKENRISELFIYPNPVKDILQISMVNDLKIYTAVVTGADGKKVFSGSGTVVKIIEAINKDISMIKPGIYFINLLHSEISYRGRFIKN